VARPQRNCPAPFIHWSIQRWVAFGRQISELLYFPSNRYTLVRVIYYIYIYAHTSHEIILVLYLRNKDTHNTWLLNPMWPRYSMDAIDDPDTFTHSIFFFSQNRWARPEGQRVLQRVNLLNVTKRLGRQGTCHSQHSLIICNRSTNKAVIGKGKKEKEKGKK
jgi:hypothetical protein